MFGLSVGALVVLCILLVALFTKFGARVLRPLLKTAAILVVLYLIFLWYPSWGPVVAPIANDVGAMIRTAWGTATRGPQ